MPTPVTKPVLTDIDGLYIKATITGGAGHDNLNGMFNFSEDLIGGAGNDTLTSHGRAGEADRLFGGRGADELHAGIGTVLVDGGQDILRVGETQSIDTAVLDFSAATKGINYNGLAQTTEIDGGTGLKMTVTNIERVEFTAGNHADYIVGTVGDDEIFGGGGKDTLYGSFGDDLLEGGAGADQLFGGSNNDTLDGGAGADVMTGGSGADVFILRAGETMGDRITDFQVGVDKIEFHGFVESASLQQHYDDVAKKFVSGAWDVIDGSDNVLETFYLHAPITDGSNGSVQDYMFV